MQNHVDFVGIARRAVMEHGFFPDFSPAVRKQIDDLRHGAAPAPVEARDLRALLWSSIDNRESKDLDQIEVCERLSGDDVKVRVGVADVDALVTKGCPVDAHAADNTASLYTGVLVFPMLPEDLSTDLTSLNEGKERLAIVIECIVGKDGNVAGGDVYRALVKNRAKLNYEEVGDFLEGKPASGPIARVAGLEEQLRLQGEVAGRLKMLRHAHGALDLDTAEAHAVSKDGDVVDIELTRRSRSREVIEDFMIAANGEMARFLEARGRSSIRRIVKTPKRWDRIVALAEALGEKLPKDPDSVALETFLEKQHVANPVGFPDLSLSVVKLLGPGEYDLERAGSPHTGHFGLAVQDYTHSTAPNRRFADLVTQRLLKAALVSAPPAYSDEELDAIAKHCTEKEDDARKVERFMRKVAAAALLSTHVGETFDAIVTGAAAKGTFVRLVKPPAEGRVVRGEKGMDVGDQVRVKLVATEPTRGFIDFARA